MALREKANSALTSLRMPTTRNEDYRFTDITPLLKANVQVWCVCVKGAQCVADMSKLDSDLWRITASDGPLRCDCACTCPMRPEHGACMQTLKADKHAGSSIEAAPEAGRAQGTGAPMAWGL